VKSLIGNNNRFFQPLRPPAAECHDEVRSSRVLQGGARHVHNIIILIPRNSRGYERVRCALKTCVTRFNGVHLEANAIPRSPGTTGWTTQSLSLSLSLGYCRSIFSLSVTGVLFPRHAGSATARATFRLDPISTADRARARDQTRFPRLHVCLALKIRETNTDRIPRSALRSFLRRALDTGCSKR